MSAENPLSVMITGDFNCRSSQWWENDLVNEEGKIFEPFTSDLGLHQLISDISWITPNLVLMSFLPINRICFLNQVSTPRCKSSVTVKLSFESSV